jgi:outer membrane protein assembly factor BamB
LELQFGVEVLSNYVKMPYVCNRAVDSTAAKNKKVKNDRYAGMKSASKVIAVFTIFIVLVVMIVGTIVLRHPERVDHKGTSIKSQRKESAMKVKGSWPMFHREPKLGGYTQTTLPDPLTVRWKFATNDEIKSSPAIDEGIVFIGSVDSNVYSIDLENGNQVWAYKTNGAVEATACVVEGLVFIGSSDSFLYALDAKTGLLKWKYETGGKILGSANWIRCDDGEDILIIVGSYDNKLHCLSSSDGKVVWTYETDSYVNGTAAVENNKIAFGGCDGMIHIVSAKDGSEIKRIDAGAYIAGSATILDGHAYVGNYDNVFMKADIKSGQVLWKYTESDSPYYSSPAVTDGVVVFGGRDNRVHCLETDNGKKIWTFQTLGEVDSSPVICGDKIVVGCEDGRLYMLKLLDGSKIWSFETGQAISSSPAVVDDTVVIGCDDGYVYAFGPRR